MPLFRKPSDALRKNPIFKEQKEVLRKLPENRGKLKQTLAVRRFEHRMARLEKEHGPERMLNILDHIEFMPHDNDATMYDKLGLDGFAYTADNYGLPMAERIAVRPRHEASWFKSLNDDFAFIRVAEKEAGGKKAVRYLLNSPKFDLDAGKGAIQSPVRHMRYIGLKNFKRVWESHEKINGTSIGAMMRLVSGPHSLSLTSIARDIHAMGPKGIQNRLKYFRPLLDHQLVTSHNLSEWGEKYVTDPKGTLEQLDAKLSRIEKKKTARGLQK